MHGGRYIFQRRSPSDRHQCTAYTVVVLLAFPFASPQEEEINRALLASENSGGNLPPPPAANGAKDGDACNGTTAGTGASGGRSNSGSTNLGQRSRSPPLPPLLEPSSDDTEGALSAPTAVAAAAAAAGAKTDGREGLVSRSGSNTTDISDDPTAGSFVNNDDVGVARGDRTDVGEDGAHRPGRSADGVDSVQKSNSCADDVGGAGGCVDRGRGRSRSRSPPATANATPPEEEPTAAEESSAADGDDGGRGEGMSAVLSPAIGSRLLSAPLGVLSAVGAWATGRGKGSAESAADAAADAAAEAAAAVAGLDHRPTSVGGSDEAAPPSNGMVDGGNLAAEDASLLPDTSASLEARARDHDGDADARRPPDLELEDPPQGVPSHRGGGGSTGGGHSSARRPPSVHLPEDDGMDLDVPLKSRGLFGKEGEGEGEATAASAYGKRKPERSPAVTPDGPNPGQHFGDTADGSLGVAPAGAAAGGEQDWRVLGPSAAKITGSRRSKGKTTTAAGPSAGSATASPAFDESALSRAGSGGAAERDRGVADNSENVDAAVGEPYNATARWRAARSATGGGGAGSRRGQPHPRGLDDSAAARGGGNPWLATAPALTTGEQPAQQDRAGRVDSNAERERRYPISSVGIDTSLSPHRDGRAGARARASSRPRAEQAWQRPEQTAPPTTTARYHSRTRLPEGAWGGPLVDQPLENNRRGVRDGIDTMSLDNSSGAGRQREEGHRRSGSSSRGGGRSSGDPPPYLQQQTRSKSLSAGTSEGGGGERGSSLPPSEVTHDGIYYPGPSPASVAARRVLRAQASSSSSPSSVSREHGGDGGSSARSASIKDFGRRAADVVGGYTVGDEWEGLRRSRGGASTAAAAQEDEEEAGCFVGGSGGGGRYDVPGGREGSNAAGYRHRHREDPDWRESEAAHSRRLSSSSTSSSSYRSIYPSQRSNTRSSYNRGGGAKRSPSPAPLPPYLSSSSSWKSASLRRALEGPATTTATAPLSLSSSAAGKRPSSSSSYLASKLAGAGAAAAGSASSYVPGAVAAHGLSSRGRLSSTGGGASSVRSSGSVRSSSGSGLALSGSYEGQTLSSLRRSRAAQERRALEATGGGAGAAAGGSSASAASRSRNAYAGAPKFY